MDVIQALKHRPAASFKSTVDMLMKVTRTGKLTASSLRSVGRVEVRQVHGDGHEGVGQGGVWAVAVVGRLGPPLSRETANHVVVDGACQLWTE